jgi:LmbE family N-acetylglucosaminyl deacetylase
MKRVLISFFLATLALPARGEEPTMDAGSLAHALDRLTSTGRVLYLAAHPDDENTRLLTHLANQRHFAAAYLSMTRGGGGQNLIGREQDELLDVVRTEELLAARKLDGAIQKFSRMRDFGYSKTAEETLKVWGHDEALSDVVWVIRSFQPDIIITRFDEKPPNHGHHTSSAILAREAFAAAADASKFPEQLSQGVTVWKTPRLLNNVSSWREGPPPKESIELDVGAYDPRFGLSHGELAARSRTQHKSQGFGVPGERGPLIERFLYLAGSKPEKDIFEGLELGYARYGAKAAAFSKAIDAAREKLSRDNPERALPDLLVAHRALEMLPNEVRTRDAKIVLEKVILASAGLFVRATAPRPVGVPGSSVPVKLEILLRRPTPVKVSANNTPLALNDKKELTREVRISNEATISTPYWFGAKNQKLVGQPKGPAFLSEPVDLTFDDRKIHLEVPVEYSWTDRVHGERLRDFLIYPPATITPERHAVMFPNGKKAAVILKVRAGKDALAGKAQLELPEGWKSEPPSQPVNLAKLGDETIVRFDVTPPKGATAIEARPVFEENNKTWSYREDVIDYPHIPMQVILQPAKLKLATLPIALPKGLVGYVEGSGDTIAEDLVQAGMRVEKIDDDTLRGGDLDRYSSIVLGIRAYNTRASLKGAHERLLRYAEKGGVVVVQYNTHSRFSPLDSPIGPYPLELGRDRVTDENAEMVAINPKHPVLNTPNRIVAADYAGWVQERGLYFGSKVDPKYEAIYKIADPGEPASTGSLLIAKVGKGRWIYTGLAFFRQLPAGVPGAYRLFTNLLAR